MLGGVSRGGKCEPSPLPISTGWAIGLQGGGSVSALSWGCVAIFSGGAGVAVVGVTPCIPGHLEVFHVSVPLGVFY